MTNKSFRLGVRVDVRHYTLLMRRAAREGITASEVVRRAIVTMFDNVEHAVVSNNGSQTEVDEVEGRNPLEYVRAVREELERRARQHAGAKRW